MDSNLWYRNAKARDFRSIPGIAGGFHLGGCRQDLSPTLGSADCPILGSGLPGRRTGGGPDRFSGIDNGDGLRPRPAGRGVTRLAGPDFMIEIVVHRPARP